MTKAQLKTDIGTKLGFIAIITDVVDKILFADDGVTQTKKRCHFDVEYLDTTGNTQVESVFYIEDVATKEVKYQGQAPVFQDTEVTKLAALYAYIESKNAWKTFNIEYINAKQSFALLTTTQKDTANKWYTQRVMVINNNLGVLVDNNVEPLTYIPV
jgi:hypothetical protein